MGVRSEVYQVTIERDPATGVVVRETWANEEQLPHRPDGPAQINRDSKTGVITSEAWLQNGHLDRLDGPAQILRNAKTGSIYYSAWYRRGRKIQAPKSPRTRSKATSKNALPRLG